MSSITHARLVERAHGVGDVHPAGNGDERELPVRLLAERLQRRRLVRGVAQA